MKYRRLTLSELSELKSEFINFLAVNGYAAEDWEKFQQSKDPKHDEMIATFSDMVMERVLSNISYLEHRSEKSLMLFRCFSDEMLLTSIRIKEDIGVTFTDDKSVEVGLQTDLFKDGTLSYFTTSKRYSKSRQEDVFELTQGGCWVVTEEYYNNIVSSIS